jgi:hypothetical protein
MNEQKAFLISLGGMACSLVFAFWQNYVAFALCGLSFAVGVYFMFLASSLHITNLNAAHFQLTRPAPLAVPMELPPTAPVTTPAPDTIAISPPPKISGGIVETRTAAGISSGSSKRTWPHSPNSVHEPGVGRAHHR